MHLAVIYLRVKTIRYKMINKDLIQLLQKLPEDVPVNIFYTDPDGCGWIKPIDKVARIKKGKGKYAPVKEINLLSLYDTNALPMTFEIIVRKKINLREK
jgi:hypothetical protein